MTGSDDVNRARHASGGFVEGDQRRNSPADDRLYPDLSFNLIQMRDTGDRRQEPHGDDRLIAPFVGGDTGLPKFSHINAGKPGASPVPDRRQHRGAAAPTGTATMDMLYPHYFKNVEHLRFIDVYRVLDLFGVTDQAIGHAIKKLLVAGGRGAKSRDDDVRQAVDTLVRWQAMQIENNSIRKGTHRDREE